MRAAATRAASWLAANQRADGSFLYQSTPDGTDLGDYNDVRHAGVLLALYRNGAVEPADRGLAWALARLSPARGGVALASGTVAATGGAALLVSALVERRARTGDDSHDDDLRALGRFLVGMQRRDGGFYVSVDVSTGELDRTSTSRYYPGEALWALTRLGTIFPNDSGWWQPARRAAQFIATERDDVEGVTTPPLNDHWAAYGFDVLAAHERLSPEVLSYARTLYGRFALLIRTESQRDHALIAAVHGQPRRSAALGTWVEGQAALARMPALHDLRSRATRSAQCGAGVLLHRQAENGAWYDTGQTRMDDEQHAISGLMGTAAL